MAAGSLSRVVGYSHSGSWKSATVKFNTSSTEYVFVDDMVVGWVKMGWMNGSKYLERGFS